ncbi:MAG: phospholipase, partial [Nanoarchaeota archaeon]|nr:phospholipase [Nanoarchaeota archaeon]
LLEDLIDAHERGVKIRVLLDESDWSPSIGKDNKKTIDYLIENGIQAKLDNPKKTLHVKLLIIDDSIIIGSTNLGFHALERNNEASILITNSEITEYYKTYFETLW